MFAKIVQLHSPSSLTAPQNIYKITADDDAHAWSHREKKENYLPNSQQMPISWNKKKSSQGTTLGQKKQVPFKQALKHGEGNGRGEAKSLSAGQPVFVHLGLATCSEQEMPK